MQISAGNVSVVQMLSSAGAEAVLKLPGCAAAAAADFYVIAIHCAVYMSSWTGF